MNKALTYGLILGLAALVGAAVFGGCRGHGFGKHNPERMYKMLSLHIDDALDDLEVDATQREKINAVKDRLFKEWRGMHEKATAHKKDLLAQWRSANPDPAAFRAHADEHAEHMKTLGKMFADAVVELHGILTPEQRAKVADKFED